MHTTPLNPQFGVEIHGIDLNEVTEDHLYPQIRALFEEHSALLFRGQDFNEETHLRFGKLFGPLENRAKEGGPQTRTSPVSNRDRGANHVQGDDRMHLLNLQANQLWHTDSTFLPVPALANILTAKVVSSTGGETELASTRVAYANLPADLREQADAAVLLHRYAHSRAKLDPELAKDELFTMWEDQAWPAVWSNPVNGRRALYLASHAFAVKGMKSDEGSALIDALMDRATAPEIVYSHRWQVGDVLMWDQRAVMHRGRPWPYEEERTLASICVSLSDDDGLREARARSLI